MIISHKYRYVFIELPQTGSTSIARELMEHYDGQKVLFKHALYHQFLAQASEDEKKYFAFSSIRNPLDVVVSTYFKIRTNHDNFNQNPVHHGKWVRRKLIPLKRRLQGKAILEGDLDFPSYFKRFHRWPYSSWSIVDHRNLDAVMRFENLGEDFKGVLERLGIDPVRELPQKNKTGKRDRDFASYYDTPELKAQAIRVFAPYMKDWGYRFPEEWKASTEGSRTTYNFVNFFRRIYWRYLR